MTCLMLVSLLSLAGASAALAADPAALMTQGKVDVDMGHRAEAAKAFETVAEDSAAPASLRAEALVRLGLVRRDGGDEKGAAEAFARVWKEHRQDKEAMGDLIRALGGALPGKERWDEVWSKIVVVIDPSQASLPSTRIEWPGVPARALRQPALSPGARGLVAVARDPRANPGWKESQGGPHRQTTPPITLDFKDGDLQDIFRLFADITGLNVVVHPGVAGSVTFKGKDLPWDDVLDRLLAPNGLTYALAGPVLEIARPEELPPLRRFEGKPIDLDFKGVDLREALRQAAAKGGRSLTPMPGLAGSVTIKLVGVPWDQAFELLARVNGLVWEDDGKTIRVGLPSGPR
jgi:hypothetical protein